MTRGRTRREESDRAEGFDERRRGRTGTAGRDGRSPVHVLQQTHGNGAVQRLVEDGTVRRKPGDGSPGDGTDREAGTDDRTETADDSGPSLSLAGVGSGFRLTLDPALRAAISNAGPSGGRSGSGGEAAASIDPADLFPRLGSIADTGRSGRAGSGVTPPPEPESDASAGGPSLPDPSALLGLENLRAVHAGGVNPNRMGSGVTSSSETDLGGGFSLQSERRLTVPDRTIFGERTDGLRAESYTGLRSAFVLPFLDAIAPFDEVELEVGQNSVTATGRLGDLETQEIGRVRLEVGWAELVYRNDHDFFELANLDVGPLDELLGGGTDEGLTAAVDLNLDLVEANADPELFDHVYLEAVGASLELNTGEPLQYGATADEVPVYDRDRIRHPEVDRGDLALTSLLRHRPSDATVSLGAGVNSSEVRDTAQGDVIHRPMNVPVFPVTPYLEFLLHVEVSVPF